jgi:Na+/H+-dicarboxylate symporter
VKPLRTLEGYLNSFVEAKLWVKVVVAIFLGTGIGYLMIPNTGLITQSVTVTLGNWLALPGLLFLKLVQMIMIPLILASIITGIINAGNEQLQKLGVGLTIYFVSTTAIAVSLGVIISQIIKPGRFFLQNEVVIANGLGATQNGNTEPTLSNLPKTISSLLPDNPLASMVSGEMLPIVLFAIIIGIAISKLSNEHKNPIISILNAIQEICMTVVKWAMILVPFAVFGLMAQLTSNMGISSLKGIGIYILAVLFGLFILLLIYMLIVYTLGKSNPFEFLSKIKDVQLLAFSTTSSAAVMPLSIKTAQDSLGVSKGVSNFLIPVGATVNMDGTALYQCISTFFIAQAYGIDLSLPAIMIVIFTIIAASIGTPAIPGGGVIILASVLQSAGIPTEGVVMIIGVERILGMFRAAINVTGDLTACMVFKNYEKKWNNS